MDTILSFTKTLIIMIKRDGQVLRGSLRNIKKGLVSEEEKVVLKGSWKSGSLKQFITVKYEGYDFVGGVGGENWS